ncbi:MAG: SDR family NAD(P)-dependent oxidoreductase [Pseudomonadota bacterium]
MAHPAFTDGSVALITGGAAGIGLALGERFAASGMAVVIADLSDDLETSAGRLEAAGARAVMARQVNVADRAALSALEAEVARELGGVDILINNAGIQPGSALFGDPDAWEAVLSVNLRGVIHGTQVFAPRMITRGRPGAIINTGSKQGITTPPGDPAYNVAKAGVKAFTEALAHELRSGTGAHLTAHLLVPGFVYTGLTARGRTEKPAGAWTADELADFAIERWQAGDFYLLCPDNDVPRSLDEKRIAWAAGDLIENRPALSRWHPDYADAFAAFIATD